MFRRDFKRRVASGSLLLCLAVIVSGTKACQRDYDFAGQASVTPNPTTDPDSATETPTDTPTETPTETPADSTVDETATPDVSIPESETGSSDEGVFTELSALGRRSDSSMVAKSAAEASSGNNWLGEAFSKNSDVQWVDADNDGYSDELEELRESDVHDASSVPGDTTTSKLEQRIVELDLSLEDLSNARAESVFPVDTDGNSGIDTDGDGVSDDIEQRIGINPTSMDSDNDGLRDDRELVLGSNPFIADTDCDGISDLREVLLGSDPVIPDR